MASELLTLDFSPLALIFLCAAVLAALAGTLFGLRPLWATSSIPLSPPDVADDEEIPSGLPKLSVIVYAFTDLESIPGYLASLLGQNYPDFEVIVVFSASAEATATLSEEIASAPNLYLTFIPPGSHNLSRRKLALTIGMKAAKGDVAIFTSSNCAIPSDHWLRDMALPFRDPRTDLCLGYTHPDLEELSGCGKYYKVMDATLSACSWIAAAKAGHPYRGDSNNMAIRRSTFFNHKGFARTISLHTGDDDIFVREVARKGNTALSLTPGSMLTTHWGLMADKSMTVRKAQYDFTRYYLPQGPFLRAGFSSLCQWAVLAFAIAGAVTGLPSLYPAAVALVTLLCFWATDIMLYRRAAARLEVTRLWWSVPFFMLWRPIGNFIFRLRHRSRRYANFTWNRHRNKHV